MNVLDLFSGIGGFSLGLQRAGMKTIAFCEIDKYCQKVLKKNFPDIPIYDDVCKLTGSDIHEPVDLICGGFPCQPFSVAGKRLGAADDRHLWPEYLRLIQELRPTWVIGENVAGLINMGLDNVLSDLEGAGYSSRTFVIPAIAVDAKHRRDRLWIVAYSNSNSKSTQSVNAGQICQSDMAHSNGINWGRKSQQSDNHCGETIRNEFGRGCSNVAYSNSAYGERSCVSSRIQSSESNISSYGGNENFSDTASVRQSGQRKYEQSFNSAESCNGETNNVESIRGSKFWATEPNVGRVANGIPHRMDRLKGLGNAVVPQIPEIIGNAIMEVSRS